MMLRHRPIGDDGDDGVRAQRSNPGAQRAEDAATDHDVIAALRERHVDDDRIAGAHRDGHGMPAACGRDSPGRSTQPTSAAMISLTMVSCGTSRDEMVTSACA